MPSLVSFLDDRTLTALVAPNNNLAAFYRIWLHQMGVIPGVDIGLLSFDNNPECLAYRLSTVGIGHETMGYQPAHLFVRGVPVKTDRDGYLVTTPRFVDRGSLVVGP